MDETEDTTAAPVLTGVLANLKVESKPHKLVSSNGTNAADLLVATWGEPPRTVAFKPLNLADQFDLVELTGSVPDNLTWSAMAEVATAYLEENGIPVSPMGSITRSEVKQRLAKLGTDGLQAGMLALRGYGQPAAAPANSETQHRAAVGN